MSDKVCFITEENQPFQIANVQRISGTQTKKHYHPSYKRTIETTSECIIIRQGQMEIEFFDNEGAKIDETIVKKGDIVIFISGGHKLLFLDNCDFIEIRQGPYNSQFDKEYF